MVVCAGCRDGQGSPYEAMAVVDVGADAREEADREEGESSA